MAKVYLIAPHYGHVYEKINSKTFGIVQPPLGLAYIASFLKNRGHSVKLFDSIFSRDSFKDIKEHIDKFRPDFVGITATTPVIAGAFLIAEYIKNIDSSIKIIFGGPHVSALPEETLLYNQSVDIVVCGEGEITLSEIIEDKKTEDIKGVCFRKEGGIEINPPRPLIENLDSLPFPLLEELPVRSYHFYHFLGSCVSILSGRGCAYNCSFCASGVINQHRYRMRSPLNFVDEVSLLHKKYYVRNFYFCDDTFTLDKNRLEEICSLILKRKLPIKWECSTRVDHLTRQALKIMKRAGCYLIGIGIESGDEAVLKATGKNITLEQVKDVAFWAKELNIKVAGYFSLGLPYETLSSLERTLKFSKKLSLDFVHFGLLTPFPGTPVWDIVEKGKILRCIAKNWGDYVRYGKAIVESNFLSAEQLLKYQRYMIRSYFFDPKYIVQRIINIRSFDEFVIYLRGLRSLFRLIL